MSYIHEALNKAQKKRDWGYQKYGGILTATGKERSLLKNRTVWLSFLTLVIIFIAFMLYSWLDFTGPEITATTEHDHKKPAAVPRSESIVDANKLYGKARLFHKSGRLQDARRLYQETLKADPGHVDALNNLGVIDIHENDFLAARNRFEKAVRLNPGGVNSYYNLACVYALSGDVSQSLAHLRKALSLDQSVRDWARRDTDLRNLHGTAGFEQIISDPGIGKLKTPAL